MATVDQTRADAMEQEYDPSQSWRPLTGVVGPLAYLMLLGLALYQYYGAGFGTPAAHWHKGIFLGVVLFLIFLVFDAGKRHTVRPGLLRPGNVPWYDWLLAVASLVAALYLPFTIESLTFRIGSPNTTDLVMGTILIVTVFEATRRVMGIVLPIIVLAFLLYGVFGQYAPFQVLRHPGTSWDGFVSHVYMTTEGIYGIPLGVISTVVFHFVLFGTIATRMGLGQFFIDIAQCVAGRYPGGPAKVAVIASSMFGTINGSSIANTVTTGALTIPAMKRIGYRPHFAGAVEAASSTGGQITPPIMGAAAFVMVEFLEIPYTTIILAAAIPAAMHYLGVLTIVHLEAKRLGLKGLPREEVPRFLDVLKRGWPTMLPLIALIWVLFSGATPFLAAFWGITGCIIVGLVNPMNRVGVRDILDAFQLGAKYALVVGAAAAAVGIVVGVVTISGAGFRVSFMVTSAAADLGGFITGWGSMLPFGFFSLEDVSLFLTLVFIGIACIVMGAGIPTTALYIILVSVAAPALVQQGIPPLAAHLFVLYFGVLADITPPVCTSAYAAGAIAGANPFRTGVTAFKLGNAKVMVPFVFVYAPTMLIVLPEHFTIASFLFVTLTCAIGVILLATALTGYWLRPLAPPVRLWVGIAAVLVVVPALPANLVGAAMVAPVILWEVIALRRRDVPAPEAAE
ncbi:TRAP transporter permease [Acuticoccus sp.]|uniref:TRAP transporter permease n=1 Tax=Acuticoccus sp. TaxID=1904378 RepID=UPI003B527D76